MLTRLEVNGFKNLVNFALDFGPYTCIAGPNGVGKSNIFDAIKFLSLLTDHTINQAALRLRNVAEDTGDISDLFFSGGGAQTQRIEFAVEMMVDRAFRTILGERWNRLLPFCVTKSPSAIYHPRRRLAPWVACVWSARNFAPSPRDARPVI